MSQAPLARLSERHALSPHPPVLHPEVQPSFDSHGASRRHRPATRHRRSSGSMFEVTGREHAVAPHGGGSFRILLSARPARSLRTRPHCLRGQRRGFLRVEDELAIRPDPSLLKYVPPGDHCSGLSLLVVTWLRASACSQMLGAIWAPESPVPTSPRQKSAATNNDDPWPQRLPAGRHQI